MSSNYDILIKKLDFFIRKYYKNQLIKGIIYCIAILLIFYLLVNLLEYLGRFGSIIRTVIFYSYIVLNLSVIIKYIVVPGLRWFKIGKIISHSQAAEIIGNYFPQINDKLTNTLQLKSLSEINTENSALLEASIEQKTTDLKSVSFASAIDISKNKRYLKYALIPVLVITVLLLSAPSFITDPTQRLIRHNDLFEKETPFKIRILNDQLEAIQNEDYLLNIEISGEEIPDEVYLISRNSKYKLVKRSKLLFYHSFNNLQKDQEFYLEASDYSSEKYTLKVFPKPIILDFDISLNFPDYTGIRNKVVVNNGDLIIPVGTIAEWKFYTRNTDEIDIGFGNSSYSHLETNTSNTFIYQTKLLADEQYYITTANSYLDNVDTLKYAVNVIPDMYPTIFVDEFRDSIYENQMYFRGTIRDDYGFNRLIFNYKLITKSDIENVKVEKLIAIASSGNPQQFFYYFNLADISIEPGNQLEYYFEIWDNDEINGSKSSRSQIMTYKVPSLSELQENTENENDQIKKDLEEALKEAKEINKDIEELSKDLIDKQELSWEEKQKIQELLDQQMDLREKLEDIKKRNEEKNLKENQFNQLSEQLLEKQRQIEELFEKLAENEEINKLFEQLKELLEEVEKEKVNEMLEEIKLSIEDLEKMLDRDLELFKQLEFEDKLTKTIDKLDKLAEKQKELAEKSKDKENSIEELLNEQKEIKEEFDDVKEDLDDLEKKNEDLEQPNDFDKMEEEQEDIESDMEQGKNSLEKNKRKKASGSQGNAGEKMKKMSQELAEMQNSMMQDGMGEDIESLRVILENLIQLSFNQEALIDRVSNINLNDPQYIELIQEQKNIKDDLKAVEDSLFALSKRQVMIEPFISKEISSINENIEKSIEYLNNRNTRIAATREQYVMTAINNLALLLSETLNQMMQSMMQQPSSCSSEGQSGTPKPGAGKGAMKSMRQLQQQLNEQIEALKKGKQKGKNKDGSSSSNLPGQKSMSEQLARMAAEQEALRNMLSEYSDQLEKEGQFGSSKELKKLMHDMEKTEEDLVNKRISQQTLMRQKSILTRLLKSENAEMEREMKQERESKETKNKNIRNPEELLKYKKIQLNHVELLKTIPPTMKPYYKSKINQYFYNFEELLEK